MICSFQSETIYVRHILNGFSVILYEHELALFNTNLLLNKASSDFSVTHELQINQIWSCLFGL